jgi:hypothetical protein
MERKFKLMRKILHMGANGNQWENMGKNWILRGVWERMESNKSKGNLIKAYGSYWELMRVNKSK